MNDVTKKSTHKGESHMANRHETVLPFLILISIVHLTLSDTLTCTSSVTTISLNPSTDPIKTYKYPASGLYPTTTTCKWLFQSTDTSSRITFEVTGVYVDCGDTLKFYDGTSSSASVIGGSVCCSSSSSCGSSKPPETTTGSNLFVQLDSDGTSNSYETGFTVNIVVGKDESNCTASGTFNINLASSLTLTSPNFPANYPMNRICTYTYTYSSGNVQFEFIYMKVELDGGICYDFVEIFNGSSTSSPVIAKVCGDTVPAQNIYISSGTSLTIKFSSDGQATKKGFLARVTPIDQNAISSSGTTGSISIAYITSSTTNAVTTDKNEPSTVSDSSTTTETTTEVDVETTSSLQTEPSTVSDSSTTTETSTQQQYETTTYDAKDTSQHDTTIYVKTETTTEVDVETTTSSHQTELTTYVITLQSTSVKEEATKRVTSQTTAVVEETTKRVTSQTTAVVGNNIPFVADNNGTNSGVIAGVIVTVVVILALCVAGGVIHHKKKQKRSVNIENEKYNEDKKEKIPDVTNQMNIQLSPPPAGTKCVT